MPTPLAHRVLDKWNHLGIARDDDVASASAALDALERLRAIVLPPSFRELWSLSDGTGGEDDEQLIFWPLDNIASDPSLGPWQGLLVFAEWQLGSVYYCVRFESDRACAVVDATGRAVAASFDDFLERYVEDPKRLIRVER